VFDAGWRFMMHSNAIRIAKSIPHDSMIRKKYLKTFRMVGAAGNYDVTHDLNDDRIKMQNG
jgi:hypothetical protein